MIYPLPQELGQGRTASEVMGMTTDADRDASFGSDNDLGLPWRSPSRYPAKPRCDVGRRR